MKKIIVLTVVCISFSFSAYFVFAEEATVQLDAKSDPVVVDQPVVSIVPDIYVVRSTKTSIVFKGTMSELNKRKSYISKRIEILQSMLNDLNSYEKISI